MFRKCVAVIGLGMAVTLPVSAQELPVPTDLLGGDNPLTGVTDGLLGGDLAGGLLDGGLPGGDLLGGGLPGADLLGGDLVGGLLNDGTLSIEEGPLSILLSADGTLVDLISGGVQPQTIGDNPLAGLPVGPELLSELIANDLLGELQTLPETVLGGLGGLGDQLPTPPAS
ncbi:MAG: hypothetical protein RJQ08_11035 [Salinisphaeraceae bacterium]